MAGALQEDVQVVEQLSAPAQDPEIAAVGRQGDIAEALADSDIAHAAAIPEQSAYGNEHEQDALGEQGEPAESDAVALQGPNDCVAATAGDIRGDPQLSGAGGDAAAGIKAYRQEAADVWRKPSPMGLELQEGQESAVDAAEPVDAVVDGNAELGAEDPGSAAVEGEKVVGSRDAEDVLEGAEGRGAEQAVAAQGGSGALSEPEAEQQEEQVHEQRPQAQEHEEQQQGQAWEQGQQQDGEQMSGEDEAAELGQTEEGEEQVGAAAGARSASFGSVPGEPVSAADEAAESADGSVDSAAHEQEQQQQQQQQQQLLLGRDDAEGSVAAEEGPAYEGMQEQEDPEPQDSAALAAAGPGADEDGAAAGAHSEGEGEGEGEGESQQGEQKEDAESASDAQAAVAAGQDAPPADGEPYGDGRDEDACGDEGEDEGGEEQRDGHEQGGPVEAEGGWRQGPQQQEEEEQQQWEGQEEELEQDGEQEEEEDEEEEGEGEQQDPGPQDSFTHGWRAPQGGAAAAAAAEDDGAEAEAEDYGEGAEAEEEAEYDDVYSVAADPQAAPPSLPRSPSGPTGAVAAMGHLPPIHSPNGPLPARDHWHQQEEKVRQPYAKEGRASGGRGAGGAKQQPGRSSPARATQHASARQQHHGSHGSPSKRQPRQQQQQQRQVPPQQAAAGARPAALQLAPAPPSAAPAPSERSPRLKDVLQGDDPDPHSITQHYLRLLKEGALSRPGTAPAGAAQEPTSPGAASTISAPAMATRGGGSAQGPRQHPTRPLSSASTASSSTAGVSPHAADLARMQARSAWEPTPVPLRTHSGGGGTRPPSAYDEQPSHLQQHQVVSPRSPAGGASRSSLPPLSVQPQGPAASAPGSRAGSPPRSFRALRPEVPSRVFTPRPTTSAAPYAKMYTPGPGAYSPTVSRRGDAGTLGCGHVSGASPPRAFSFGGATQRPHHVCIHTAVDSPGPAYLPSKDALSTTHTTPNYKFDRALPGARASLTAGVPTNAPMHNPGAGTYDPAATPHGEPLSPGAAAPAHAFPRGRKSLRPATAGGALPVISKEHMREFHGTCSPGPAAYSPDVSPTRGSPPAYSVASKPASVFERPSGDTTTAFPGPGAYHPGELDRAGHRTLGDAPHAVMGTGPKLYDPVEHLPAAPWLGMAHARRVNLGVHSPGPAVYAPRDPRVGHVASPLLASGPKERFSGRHEPGRLQ